MGEAAPDGQRGIFGRGVTGIVSSDGTAHDDGLEAKIYFLKCIAE